MRSEQCPIQVEYRNFDDIPTLYIAFIAFSIAYAFTVNRGYSPSLYLKRAGIGFHCVSNVRYLSFLPGITLYQACDKLNLDIRLKSRRYLA